MLSQVVAELRKRGVLESHIQDLRSEFERIGVQSRLMGQTVEKVTYAYKEKKDRDFLLVCFIIDALTNQGVYVLSRKLYNPVSGWYNGMISVILQLRSGKEYAAIGKNPKRSLSSARDVIDYDYGGSYTYTLKRMDFDRPLRSNLRKRRRDEQEFSADGTEYNYAEEFLRDREEFLKAKMRHCQLYNK